MRISKIKNYKDLPIMLTVQAVADVLGVSDSSVYALIQTDKFPHLHVGNRIVVPREALLRWIEDHTEGVREM